MDGITEKAISPCLSARAQWLKDAIGACAAHFLSASWWDFLKEARVHLERSPSSPLLSLGWLFISTASFLPPTILMLPPLPFYGDKFSAAVTFIAHFS